MNPPPAGTPDVVVVGGGPVGLLTACLLADRGVRVTMLEKRTGATNRTMAIGITPPSLEILRGIGVDQAFVERGVRVRTAEVHEGRHTIGRLHFDGIETPYPFVLSIPQPETVDILTRAVRARPSITMLSGHAFECFVPTYDGLGVTARCITTGATVTLRARYLAGCDGVQSAVRTAAGLRAAQRPYAQRFVMADFDDGSGLGEACHLFFSATESVESFPLPAGQRRWIVLTPGGEPADPAAHLVERVRALTGHDLSGGPARHVSCFGARWMLAERYHAGSVVLAGDAAHCMSSIGGQGMNTGFADAELLAAALACALGDPARREAVFEAYETARKRAFRVAARRAETGMWLGTKRGRISSVLRRHFIRRVLFSRALAGRLAPHFAMLTIPFNNLERYPELGRMVLS